MTDPDFPCRDLNPSEEAVRSVRAMRASGLEAPQSHGLWYLERTQIQEEIARLLWGEEFGSVPEVTTLERWTDSTLHLGRGEVVMSDDPGELCKHLSGLLAARGRVLVSGLGLGCVVRGMLARPEVEHVDVVELDSSVLRMVGPSFEGEPRVALHHGDAREVEWPPGTRWDVAWHDVWCEKPVDLHKLHAELFARYRLMARRQGAWAFPRLLKRRVRSAGGGEWLIT